MIHSQPHPKYHAGLLLMLSALFVVSCGSYQQASYYDNDGIYANETPRVSVERYQQPQRRVAREENNVYSNYFGQKAEEYGEILDSEIFTDVDAYSGTAQDSLNLNSESDYYYDPNNDYQGYAGWGDNATSVTVNVYDNWGWNDPWFWGGYGWNYGWGWNSPWRWNRWGWGWNYGWGWNSWGWGWNNWGWAGYYGSPYYWGGYYGYPYYGYGYYGYPYYRYGRGYYGYGSYAYNRSRRGIYDNSLAAAGVRGRSNLNSRLGSAENSRYRTNTGRSNLNTRPSYSRSTSKYSSGTYTRRSVGVDGIERNRSYRSSRATRALPRYNSQSRSSQIYRGSSSARSGNYSRTSPQRSSGYRSSGSSSSSRSSSGYRSSGSYSSPSRNSGYRSSGSSSPSRSSGYRSSGGSSSRSSGSFSRGSSGSSRSSGGRSSGGGGGRRSQ